MDQSRENLRIEWISIGLLKPNSKQPRKLFNDESLLLLSQSVIEKGILTPLLVEKLGSFYKIISGERRYLAALKAGFEEIPVIIRKFSSQESFEAALIENIQRENLTPLEEALSYEKMQKEFGLTQEQIAKRISKKRASVANLLRILSLSNEMKESLHRGEISLGHAKVLAGIENTIQQHEAYLLIRINNWSVRDLENFISQSLNKKNFKNLKPNSSNLSETSSLLIQMENELLHKLGSQVNIKGTQSKGKITIAYSSQKEFEILYRYLLSVNP